jgi:ApbE superfamily uncharacterized protein (UPF0280 family)
MPKKDPLSYTNRSYRSLVEQGDLIATVVMVQETDLHIMAEQEVRKQSHDLVCTARNQIEAYIRQHPEFHTSLIPLPLDTKAPPLIQAMLNAGVVADIGPMGAVAGGIAEFVGVGLIKMGLTEEVMVENGGDVFLHRHKECCISIFAGESPLSQKVGIKINQDAMPLGICSSSASIGHSLSLGTSDAVTVLARDTTIADTVATRLGNEMQDDMNHALDVAKTFPDIQGVVIIKDKQLGAWGNVELIQL